MRVLLGVSLLTIATAAYADPPGSAMPPQPSIVAAPAPAPPPPASGDLDRLASNDAASSRGFVFDSGSVLHAGEVETSLRTIIETGSALSLAVGVGGGVQLSVDGLYGQDGRYEALGGQVRMRVLGGPRYAVSIAAGYHWASSSLDEGEPTNGSFLTFGGDLALAVSDRVLLSIGLGVSHFSGDNNMTEVEDPVGVAGHIDLAELPDPSTDVIGHVGLVVGRSWVRLLAEVGDIGDAYGLVGARLATRHVSVDLGVGAVTGEGFSSPAVVFGLSGRP
ncbi:MAG TPA: hypothetical protein VGL61_08545 [Kofleriaceae bacterium]|jgi:hypothetical protein